MELALSDLNDAFEKKIIPATFSTGIAIIKQLLVLVYLFQESFSIALAENAVHCDLHASNILVYPSSGKVIWKYKIGGNEYHVPDKGFYLVSYDYARTNNRSRGSCHLTIAYDYLRALSPHAGLYRAFRRVWKETREKKRQKEIINLLAIVESLLRILVREAKFENPLKAMKHDWSLKLKTRSRELERIPLFEKLFNCVLFLEEKYHKNGTLLD